jgi:hypothetical protein
LAAILQQAVHLAEKSGFPRSGDGIGALLYGARRATSPGKPPLEVTPGAPQPAKE